MQLNGVVKLHKTTEISHILDIIITSTVIYYLSEHLAVKRHTSVC